MFVELRITCRMRANADETEEHDDSCWNIQQTIARANESYLYVSVCGVLTPTLTWHRNICKFSSHDMPFVLTMALRWMPSFYNIIKAPLKVRMYIFIQLDETSKWYGYNINPIAHEQEQGSVWEKTNKQKNIRNSPINPNGFNSNLTVNAFIFWDNKWNVPHASERISNYKFWISMIMHLITLAKEHCEIYYCVALNHIMDRAARFLMHFRRYLPVSWHWQANEINRTRIERQPFEMTVRRSTHKAFWIRWNIPCDSLAHGLCHLLRFGAKWNWKNKKMYRMELK